MTTTTCMDRTTSRLLAAVDRINDEYVLEAERKVHVKSAGWIKWVAAAACLVVVVLIATPLFKSKIGGAHSVPVYNTYSTYEELAADYQDTVIEAFASSDEAQLHSVEYATLRFRDEAGTYPISCVYVLLDSPEKIDREYTEEEISLDRIGSAIDMVPTVIEYDVVEGPGSIADSNNARFHSAGVNGIRSDYMIDGVEVQKYYLRDEFIYATESQIEQSEQLVALHPDEPRYVEELESFKETLEIDKTAEELDWYWERVSIDGRWYYVRSSDESVADAVATALARIASSYSR